MCASRALTQKPLNILRLIRVGTIFGIHLKSKTTLEHFLACGLHPLYSTFLSGSGLQHATRKKKTHTHKTPHTRAPIFRLSVSCCLYLFYFCFFQLPIFFHNLSSVLSSLLLHLSSKRRTLVTLTFQLYALQHTRSPLLASIHRGKHTPEYINIKIKPTTKTTTTTTTGYRKYIKYLNKITKKSQTKSINTDTCLGTDKTEPGNWVSGSDRDSLTFTDSVVYTGSWNILSRWSRIWSRLVG